MTTFAKHRESTPWQRRFWEREIRVGRDFEAHVDFMHFNPVKLGYAQRVVDWPYSSSHRYVREGQYPRDWGDGTIDAVAAGEPT